MKASNTIAATALLACAIAKPHHGHEAYHNQFKVAVLEQRHVNASCECATSYTTYYGEATLIQNIQPNTTVQHPATTHVQITVQPVPATTSSTESPLEVTLPPVPHDTQSAPVESSQISSTSRPATYPAPTPSSSSAAAYTTKPSPSSSSLNSPIEVSPTPKPYHAPSLSLSSSPQPSYAPSPSSKTEPIIAHPSPKPHPKPQHTSPALGSTGSQWCMTYSPYTSSGDCKSASAVQSDIAAIAAKGFSSIRLYSTDCSGLAHAGSAASSHGLKLILGIFISSSGLSSASPQIEEIVSWAAGNWEGVEMIVAGNEAVFNDYCSASELAAFITECKTAFKAAGYNGPVTTTEPLNILQEEAQTLCPVLDVAAANIHPFFNADVSAGNAGAFVARELELLEGICPGLQGYNLETGWPSAGQTNGEACPGVEEQRVAVASIREVVGGRSAFFSFEDDLWKEEGEFAVERSWGCSQLFGD